jgi:putative ABC transport system permease protein
LATEGQPAIYLPLGQQPDTVVAPRLAERLMMTFLVRTTGDPMDIVPAVQPLVATVDPTRTPDKFQLLEAALSDPLASRRHLLKMLGVFTAAVLVLVTVGIHGAVAHSLSQQSREIGIRRACGAGRADLWRMTLGRLGWLLAPGIALGITVAMALSHVIANVLWGVSAIDPLTYAGASLLVCTVAVAVASGPVRRALSTSPHAVLNDE